MLQDQENIRRIKGIVAGSGELSLDPGNCHRTNATVAAREGNCLRGMGIVTASLGTVARLGTVTRLPALLQDRGNCQDQGNCRRTEAIVAATQGQIEEPEKLVGCVCVCVGGLGTGAIRGVDGLQKFIEAWKDLHPRPATPSPIHLHIVLSCQSRCEDVTISKRSQAARARAAARLKGEVTGVY